MEDPRREFGKVALAGVPALALFDNSLVGAVLAQAKPNSLINGVQVGTITYSFRSMPDQTAEAILKYTVDSGISAIELMGAPVDEWMRRKGNYAPPSGANAGGGRGGGRAGGGAGGGGRAGGGAPGAPGGGAAAGAAGAGAPGAGGGGGGGGGRGRAAVDPATLTASWNGVACAPGGGARGGGGGGARGAAAAAGAAPAGGPAAGAPPAAGADPAAVAARGGGGGGRGGGGPQTPEQIADAEYTRKWRQALPMQIFKDLKKMYSDAGVSIYAVKNLGVNATDEELEFQFAVAKELGATHVTAELPTDQSALKRVGDAALKAKIFAAYHTHLQGSITAFDQAFALSKGNMANVDFGHYVAAGGDPMPFLLKFHDRIASFHLKDRTKPEHCELNLAWGTGETPIKEILQTVKKNKWKVPASIELEYGVPQGSDAVQEVRKCLEFCRTALA